MSVPGGEYDENELYMDTTLLVDVSAEDPVMKEEIFGPLLPVISVKSPQEAVDFINDREKPLSLYVFTESPSVHQKFVDETSR